MPEGHTIHKLAKDLQRDFAGKVLAVTSPQGRFLQARVLDGETFEGAHAIGKHLFFELGGSRVHVHLGLFGRFRKQRFGEATRESVRLKMESEGIAWELTGPTACEVLDAAAYKKLCDRLGADPLSQVDAKDAWPKVHASTKTIGALLLDQSLVAGLGNVYRAEVLFLLGVHPEARGCDLKRATWNRLWKTSRELLSRGVAAGRIVSVKGANGRTPKREALHVYKQNRCRVCESPISSVELAGRPLYYCAKCQRSRA